MSEFDLIAKYFTWDYSISSSCDDVTENNTDNTTNNNTEDDVNKSNIIKSVGDDAAVLSLQPNQHLVTSIDTLVSGVHFPQRTSAYDIGYKALAVNLSDLAAMGATPKWFTLALTLPDINHEWLGEFSRGLKSLAQKSKIALVGGDTTSGPLTISIQVMGEVEKGKALLRSGAKEGDNIFVTGTLGDGAAGLQSIKGDLHIDKLAADYCEKRLNRPTARNLESYVIKHYASACIDVSDGLLQDLSHILKQSNDSHIFAHPTDTTKLGARLDLNAIPLSSVLQKFDKDQAQAFALCGGDDYELLFTVPENKMEAFTSAVDSTQYTVTCIGQITNNTASTSKKMSDNGIVDQQGNALTISGFNHFK